MRTRSQQASPGGFVSLDSERATRRTRSTRTASQSTTEPSTSQTTTRSKNQRAAKKPAPKKTTTTTTKTQTRKGTTRTTRKTTRKTTQTTPGDEAPATHNDAADENTPPNDPESIDQAHDSSKDSEPAPAPKPGLSEPNNSERESSTPSAKVPKKAITLAVPPAVTQGGEQAQQPPFPQAPSPRSTIGTSWLEYLENISDIGSPLSERSKTPSVDSSFALEGEVDDDLIAQVSEALALQNAAQPDVPTGEDPSTSELAEVGPTTTESEPANTPARVVSTESSCSATVVVSVEESAAVDELEDLAKRFSKLSLTCVPAVVSSTESPATPTWRSETQQSANETGASQTTDVSAAVSDASVDPHRLASIYNDAPPQFPYGAWQDLYPPKPAVEDQQSPSTIFGGPIPSGPSSIFDDERQAAYYLGRQSIVEGPLVSEALAEAPELIAGLPSHPAEAEPGELFHRPSTPAPGFWPRGGRTRLSPIPEEPEEPETSPVPGSSAGVEQEGSACTPAPLPAPSPVPMVDPQAPAHGPAQVPSAVSPAPPKKTKGKEKTKKTKPLTSSKVNRKRSRSETGDERAPETPIANKRRNLGPPGSTPFARRLTPLSRRLSTNAAPYSERLRRRTIESQGRIHRTVFRIPQLIAQTEADRRASESASPSPFPEPPETTFDFTVERNQENHQTSQSEPSAQQEPSTPDSSRRGWNIRGLLSSVPRSLSISRFLPFGRSPRTAESSGKPSIAFCDVVPGFNLLQPLRNLRRNASTARNPLRRTWPPLKEKPNLVVVSVRVISRKSLPKSALAICLTPFSPHQSIDLFTWETFRRLSRRRSLPQNLSLSDLRNRPQKSQRSRNRPWRVMNLPANVNPEPQRLATPLRRSASVPLRPMSSPIQRDPVMEWTWITSATVPTATRSPTSHPSRKKPNLPTNSLSLKRLFAVLSAPSDTLPRRSVLMQALKILLRNCACVLVPPIRTKAGILLEWAKDLLPLLRPLLPPQLLLIVRRALRVSFPIRKALFSSITMLSRTILSQVERHLLPPLPLQVLRRRKLRLSLPPRSRWAIGMSSHLFSFCPRIRI